MSEIEKQIWAATFGACYAKKIRNYSNFDENDFFTKDLHGLFIVEESVKEADYALKSLKHLDAEILKDTSDKIPF